MNDANKLTELRRQIDDCDQELLNILCRRMQLVEQACVYKDSSKQPLYDRERELQVIANFESSAKKIGLNANLAKRLIRLMLEESHLKQDKILPRSDQIKNFLIVGGAGRMGQRLAAAFRSRGHFVDSLEKDQVELDKISRADIVVIAVPMSVANQVAEVVAKKVRPDALLIDINSLKEDICKIMQQHCAGQVLGTHPMFGPSVKTFWGQKVIACRVRQGALVDWFISELKSIGFDVVESTALEHDRMMVLVQALTHFAKMVTAQAQLRSGIALADALNFTSPIYKLELAMIGRLFSQDPELYAEIEISNKQASQIRAIFCQEAQKLNALLDGSNRESFYQSFREVRSYLKDFSSQAMELSDRAIHSLIDEP